MVWPTSHDEKLAEHKILDLPGIQLASSQAGSPLEHILNMDFKAPTGCLRLTSIGATFGPASKDIETLEEMMEEGMNFIRIPLAYTTKADNEAAIRLIRHAVRNYSAKVGRLYPLAIAVELTGRTIHTGMIADSYGGVIELRTGDIIRLSTDDAYREKGTNYTIFVDLETIAECLTKGDKVFIDNETIQLKVEIIASSAITCKIERGGLLGSFKEVFIPGAKLHMPDYSEQDLIDIDFAVSEKIDFIIVPYVRNAEMITELKKLLGEKGKKMGIIAKVQTRLGLDHLNDILEVVNNVMIARQELGSEITLKKLPMVQKNIVARINNANVSCCITSQMLHTMVSQSNPLRAEIMDIANSVLDGADMLMLEAETSSGNFPVKSLALQAKLCKEAESCLWSKQLFTDFVAQTKMPCDSVTATAMGAVLASSRCMAAAIVVITTSGRAAQLVARFRPRCPIIAITRYPQVARQLQVWRGIVPLVFEETPNADWLVDVERRVNFGTKFGLEKHFIRLGDPVILVAGWKAGSGFTNTMRIIYATEDQTVA